MFFSSLFYPFSLSRMYVADLVFCRLYTCYYIIKRFFSPFLCFIPFPLLLFFSSTNRLPLVFYLLCKLLTSELHQCNYINTPPALIKHRRHTYLSNYIVRIERRVLHHQSPTSCGSGVSIEAMYKEARKHDTHESVAYTYVVPCAAGTTSF